MFVRTYILDRQPHEFRSPIERDWAYVVRREWNYDCNMIAAADGAAAGIFASLLR